MATKAESDYMRRVKELPCGCCERPGPSSAHHILGEDHRRVSHYATIPLCYACHQGPNGIHGDKTIWRIMKKSEIEVLADTIEALI